MSGFGSQAEVASSIGEQGKVYKITKREDCQYQKRLTLIGQNPSVKSWTGCYQQQKLTTRKQGMIFKSILHHQRQKRSSRPSSPLKTEMPPGQDNLNAELFKAALGFAAEINFSTLYNHMGNKRRNEWSRQRASL